MRSFRWIVGGCFATGLLVVSLVSARPAEENITGYYGEKDGEYTKISRNGDNVYQYLNHQKAGDWIGVAIREGDSHRLAGRNQTDETWESPSTGSRKATKAIKVRH
jgi:hypothetical protein